MISFAVICAFCGYVNNNSVAILSKEKEANYRCENCSKNYITFYEDKNE